MSPVIEGENLPNRIFGDMGIVLVDFFQRASRLKILHNGIGQDPCALDDGLTAHLAGNALYGVTTFPIHRSPSITMVALLP
jgi:hypothetical protein